MLKVRLIPSLLLRYESLVKTVKFNKFKYIGDPVNTVKIFNELEVDELVFQDICASKEDSRPNMQVLRDIANECFMPLAYGGGIKNLDEAKKILDTGFEKVILNSAVLQTPDLITELANKFGSQAVVVSIDYKKDFFNRSSVWSFSATKKHKYSPVEWAKIVEEKGAGEILLTSIKQEGTWSGFDLDTIKQVSINTSIPIIANGGCGSINHIKELIDTNNVSAIALGSIVVFQKKDMGVLVNFPDRNRLESFS